METLIRPRNSEYLTINGVSFSYGEVAAVVDQFYTRVQQDPILQVPFRSVHNWPEHVDRLTHFWWTKFGGRPYLRASYDPVTKHFLAGFNTALLSRWLTVFHEVLQKNLDPEQKELWEMVSIRMGQGLSIKNEMYKEEHQNEQRQRSFHPGAELQNQNP